MRETLDFIENLLRKSKRVKLMEDGSNEHHADVFITIGGKGYEVSIKRADQYDDEEKDNRLIHGFDYDKQAWVENGKYVRCGHPETMNCKCYGRLHEGEVTKEDM